MSNKYSIRIFSHINKPTIAAKIYGKNGISYVDIPVGTELHNVTMINNGTYFISYVCMWNNEEVIIRSEDCITL